MMTDPTARLSTTRHNSLEAGKHRHWSRSTQEFAPADVLLTHIRNGWQFDNTAPVETFYSGSLRRADIYYFTLRRGDDMIEMPVLANPKIRQLIEEHRLTVLQVNESHQKDD